MQNTAGPALVCEDGNVSRGWRVCCYMSCTSILTWGSGSCRLDTPAAPTGDPSHAWSGYRMSTACQLFTLHLVSIINKHSSKQQVVHTRQKVFEALAWRHSRIHKPEHEALLCRQDVSATSPSFAGDTLDLCWWYAPIPTAEGATVSTHWVQSAGRRLLPGIQWSPEQTGVRNDDHLPHNMDTWTYSFHHRERRFGTCQCVTDFQQNSTLASISLPLDAENAVKDHCPSK